MTDTSADAIERFTYSLHSMAQYEALPDVDKEMYSEAITTLRALAAERDALRAALEAVADTTDGQPGALVQECRQIARTALRAIAEGRE